MKTKPAGQPGVADELAGLGRIALVLQGGGALGAYQCGVFDALHEAGIEPDWIIGTSIGAINAALIAGNAPERRLERLVAFWRSVRHPAWIAAMAATPGFGPALATMATTLAGLPGFFAPNPMALAGSGARLDPERAGVYSTRPLAETLGRFIDPERLNAGAPRLTVGAARVDTGEMRYFDSARERLGLDHVLASGALPPAFPAVRIDGALYWDGGVLSNTPVEAVFDDAPRRSGVIFAVHVWQPHGPEPASLWEVANRQKDLQYASRDHAHVDRQRQIHRLRHVIAALAERLPPTAADDPDIAALRAFGCTTSMHLVRLLAPILPGEDHTRDIDFSSRGIETRWRAGLCHARAALAVRPWRGPHDPLEGFVVHEPPAGGWA